MHLSKFPKLLIGIEWKTKAKDNKRTVKEILIT